MSNYQIYDGSTITESGTVTLYGTTAVVGSSTAFSTQFRTGDVIEVNTEARVVNVVSDNTHLTVLSAFLQSASSQAYTRYRMAAIETLASGFMKTPTSDPQTYSKSDALLDGMVRGQGWMTTNWKWVWLTTAERTALKALCPGASILTFIKTRDEGNLFNIYRAIMVWPDKPDIYGQRWQNFMLAFRKLEAL
jgi:hypothetical protein